MIKNLCVGVVSLDSDATPEFASSTAWKLLGCTSEGELKQCWREFMPRLGLSRERLPKGATPFRFKADLPIHEGVRRLDLEVYGSEPEASQGYLLLVRDRQCMDSLECELLLASQMRAQPYLLSTLVHALADPLNAIEITLELLRSPPEEGVTPQAGTGLIKRWQHYVTVLDTELSSFRHNIQSFREQGARWNSNPEEIDLCAITEETAGMLHHQTQVRHIQLQLSLPKTVVMVKGRREHIRQAMLNLMIHAIEAMAGGGRLYVGIGYTDGVAEAVFQDDGPGIPSELLEDISQIHAVMTKSASGLRLYLARRVAEAHGGEMLIETQPAKGTCFRLCLPALPPAPSIP